MRAAIGGWPMPRLSADQRRLLCALARRGPLSAPPPDGQGAGELVELERAGLIRLRRILVAGRSEPHLRLERVTELGLEFARAIHAYS